jgi:hypothetical protein
VRQACKVYVSSIVVGRIGRISRVGRISKISNLEASASCMLEPSLGWGGKLSSPNAQRSTAGVLDLEMLERAARIGACCLHSSVMRRHQEGLARWIFGREDFSCPASDLMRKSSKICPHLALENGSAGIGCDTPQAERVHKA